MATIFTMNYAMEFPKNVSTFLDTSKCPGVSTHVASLHTFQYKLLKSKISYEIFFRIENFTVLLMDKLLLALNYFLYEKNKIFNVKEITNFPYKYKKASYVKEKRKHSLPNSINS